MSEIVVRRIGEDIAEIKIQPNNTEAHTVRIHRRSDGHAGVSWPMLQGVDSRTTRLYAEAMMIASRIAEEFSLPCPSCGGALEVHRKELTYPNGTESEITAGHVYRCTECGIIQG
jgi:hypothetical protein